jgi:hypothetical protein
VACERGDWEALESIGRDPAALQRAWLQAVSWSRDVVSSLELPDAPPS